MRRAFTNNMRFNFTATVVSLLLQSRAAHCSKENDEKSPITELSSFLKQFGDKNAGDVLAKAAGFSKPESNSDFNYLLDGVSENVRKVFETGKPQEVWC